MKPLFKTKRMCIATLLALVMMVAVGATLALMASSPQFLTNTFAAAEVETQINEDLTLGNKKVTIENTGKSPVYVRARIMVSGVNPNTELEIVSDEAQATAPNKVYLVMKNPSQWRQADESAKDNYYYYLDVLEPGTSTSELLTKVIVPGEDLRKKLQQPNSNFSVTVYHESVLAIDTTKTTASEIEDVFESAKSTH